MVTAYHGIKAKFSSPEPYSMKVEIIIQTKRITKEYCFVLESILQYYSLLRQ